MKGMEGAAGDQGKKGDPGPKGQPVSVKLQKDKNQYCVQNVKYFFQGYCEL